MDTALVILYKNNDLINKIDLVYKNLGLETAFIPTQE